MPAIARVNDPHSCPVSSPQPHGGGVITGPGSSLVVGYRPAAVVGTECACAGGPPNRVISGSLSVTVDHRPLAHVGSQTAHGGVVIAGAGSVMIG